MRYPRSHTSDSFFRHAIRPGRPSRGATPGRAGCRRAGLSLLSVLVSLLIVALATIAVGSTVVAMRAAEQRDRAKQDFAEASDGFDELVVAAATTVKPPRKELLQPAVDYYEKFVQTHAADKKLLPEVASARFHLAALHAKLGSKEGVEAMALGLGDLDEIAKQEAPDLATFPSLQDCALKVATPVEWFMVKDADSQYGTRLVLCLSRAMGTYSALSRKYPDDVNLRNNHAAILKGWALIQGQLPGGRPRSLESWLKARDILETLVRDQPAVQDYQVRLVESLANAARIQKTDKVLDQATANMQRAVAVREQMAAAQPDNKTLQQELTTAKRELERMKPAEAPAAAAADKPAEAPPANAPVAEARADDAKPADGSDAAAPPAETEKETPPAASGETPPEAGAPAAAESPAEKAPSAGQ